MHRVYFSHTKSREKAYQNKLLSQKQWFIDHGFPVFLPKGTSQARLDKDADIIKKNLPSLQERWQRIEQEYFAIIQSFKYVKLQPKYICHGSLFGPEGEFRSPNLLYVRLRTAKDKKLILETIGHELIHLFLGSFFDKKKLGYGEVEWLVDHLILQNGLQTLFPDYKQQSVGKPRKKILLEIFNLNKK